MKKRPGLVALVGALALMAIVVVVVIATSGGDDAEPDRDRIRTAGEVDAVALKVGDCVRDAAKTGTVQVFRVVPCRRRHYAEVYTIIALKADDYPGEKFVVGKGQRGCRARLRRRFPAVYNDSNVGFRFVYPTEETWDSDFHQVTCLATYKKARRGALVV